MEVAATRPPFAPDIVDDQIAAMQATPEDEGPAGAVPQAAEQHGDQQIRQPARLTLTAATQGDVEIVPQEAR